jgi:hypothetical protein
VGGIPAHRNVAHRSFAAFINAALHSRAGMSVAALSYVSGRTCRAAALLSKAAPLFEFAATRQKLVLRDAIFRRVEFGHCRAIHDTNLGKHVAIAEVVAAKQAKQPNPRLLAKNCYGKVKIWQENC